MKRKDWLIIIIVACGAFLITFISTNMLLSKEKKEEEKVIENTSSFNIKFIKEVNNNTKGNYVISPYSVEMALSMLRLGANENTLKQIDKVLRDREFTLENENVAIANGMFAKNEYKDVIENDFITALRNDYDSDIIFDEFKTPEKINNWVNEKTNKMIPKVVDNIEDDFVLGLANAIYIDAHWKDSFECHNTDKGEFGYKDKENVEMMHNSYEENAKYLKGDVTGIILPYKEDLEFVALMPKKDLNKFIDELDDKSFNEYLNSFKSVKGKEKVILSIPRFKYEFDLKSFKKILKDLGIKDAFNSEKADFSGIVTKDNLKSLGKENLYVGTAIHKAKIEFMEKGTKAAAVTYFGLDANAAPVTDYKEINITFDKPFMYIIRDTKTKEMLFFGTVYNPNKWKGSTCQN